MFRGGEAERGYWGGEGAVGMHLLVGLVLALALALAFGPGSATGSGGGDITPPPSVANIQIGNLFAGVAATATMDVVDADSTSCQWQLNNAGANGPTGSWTDISGATSCSSYTGLTADNAKWHRLKVIATNATTSVTGYSRPYRLGGDLTMQYGATGQKVFANNSYAAMPGLGASATAPAASPDGTMLAYSRSVTIGTVTTNKIYVSDSNGAWERTFDQDTNYSDQQPLFSPDGTRLAFERIDRSNNRTSYVVWNLLTGAWQEYDHGDPYTALSPHTLAWRGDDALYLVRFHTEGGDPNAPLTQYWWDGTAGHRGINTGNCVSSPPYVCQFRTEEIWSLNLTSGTLAMITDMPAPTSLTDMNNRIVGRHGAIGGLTVDPTNSNTFVYSGLNVGRLTQVVSGAETYSSVAGQFPLYRADGALIYVDGSNGLFTVGPSLTGTPTAYATGAGFPNQAISDVFLSPETRPVIPAPQTYGNGEAAAHPTGKGGDPVDSSTGNFTDAVTDASFQGYALPFQWTRAYNSLDPTSGPLGPGWTCSYCWTLSIAGSNATVRTGSGQQVVFTGTSMYTAPAGADSSLVSNASGWALTLASGDVYQFNSSGKLASITDHTGRQVVLTYTSGNLSKVTDAVGRQFTVTTSAGKITQVTLPDTRSFSYGYDGSGRLQTVTDLRGKVWTYAYDGTSSRLVSVLDPNGHYPFRNVYDQTSFRITSQQDALNNTTTYGWNAKTGVATTTNPAGKVWKDTYEGGALVLRSDPLGHSWHYRYDKNFHLVSLTDPRGNTVRLEYDAAGHMTSKTLPAPLNYTERWVYNTAGQLRWYVNDRGKATQYDYDANGNLADRQEPGGAVWNFGYDTSGRLTSTENPESKTTTFSYNSLDELTETETPLGEKTTYGYDSAGRLANTTDPRGNVSGCGCANQYTTSYGYDNADHLTSSTDAYGNVESVSYDDAGNKASTTDAFNKTTTYDYNAANELHATTTPNGKSWLTDYDTQGNLSSQTSPLGHKTTFGYDDANRLTSMVTPKGNVAGCGCAADYTWTYSYDKNDNRTTVSDPFGHATTTVYDVANRPTSVTDARGKVWQTTYDGNGNVLSTTNPLTQTTSYSYDSRDRLVSTTDPRNKASSFTYNLLDEKLTATDPLSNTTSYGYDNDGRLASLTDPRGNVAGCGCATQYTTTYGYDPAGNQTSVTNPLGDATTRTFDANDQTLSVNDAMNRLTQWAYDADGRVHTVEDPLGNTTTYGYDDLGRLTSVQDANLHTTTYGYDDDNRLDSTSDAAGNTWTQTYDENSNLIQNVDANGNATSSDPNDGTTTLAYNRADQLTGVSYSDTTPAVSYTYDETGNRQTMTDGQGTQTYSYDNAGRLLSVSRGSDTFSYTYDDNGDLHTRQLPDGTVYTYGYDGDSRLTSVAWNSKTVSYGYDEASNLTSTVLPAANGYTETRSYDRAGHLSELANSTSSSTLADYQLTRDNAGLPTRINDTAAGTTQTFQYDGDGRLSEVCYQASCPGGSDPFIRYSYDPVGNRLTEDRPAGTTSYSYDNLNELTAESGLNSVTYSYDADGHETAKGARTFTFDVAGQLVSSSLGGVTASNAYDGDGNIVQTTDGAVASNQLWDVNSPLPQLAITRDGSGNQTTRYNLGAGLLGFDNPSGGSFFDQYDALGNVANVTDSSGQTEWTYTYEPYGATRSATQNDPDAPANGFGFSGQQQNSTGGLYALRARQYDPTNGRFLSHDPLAAAVGSPTVSAYAYVNGMPTALTDPSGMSGISIGGVFDGILKGAYDVDAGIAGAGKTIAVGTVNLVMHPRRTVNLIGYGMYQADVLYHDGGIGNVIGGLVDQTIVQPAAACFHGGSLETTTRRCTKAAAALLPFGRPFTGAQELAQADRFATAAMLADETGSITLQTGRVAKAAEGEGLALGLSYKEDWTATQRAAADEKVAALNEAARRGELQVTEVERSGTSAAARYRRAGGTVPPRSDVDHTIDLQLGGADEIFNLNPLDFSVNRSLGSQIAWQIRGSPVGTCVISVKIC